MPAPPSKSRRRRLFRWLLAVAAALAALFACELALRLRQAWLISRVRADWARLEQARILRPGTKAGVGDLFRPCELPDLLYELIPGLDVEFMGRRVLVNQDGQRGPLVARQRPANGFRIVGIGDSVMFGWGVDEQDTFLHRTAAELQRRAPALAVEAVNLAVPGYNTAMEVAALEHRGLAWQPDLVIIDFVGNDFDLPNFVPNEVDLWTLRRSWLLDLLQRRHPNTVADGALRWAQVGDVPGSFANDPDRVEPRFRHLVGHAGYVRAMERLAALSAQHGFRVVVSCHWDCDPIVPATCRRLGIPFASSAAAARGALGTDGHDYLASDLVLSPADPHPSVRLHALLADCIVATLQQTGWFAGRLFSPR